MLYFYFTITKGHVQMGKFELYANDPNVSASPESEYKPH